MFFVERSIILCPYLGGSTIDGSTVYRYVIYFCSILYWNLIISLYVVNNDILTTLLCQCMTEYVTTFII